jgi:hypothetical protein
MFRKIRSNRNPRDTLYSEFKKELNPYLTNIRLSLKAIARKYPRFLFAMMVINIMLSAIVVIALHHPVPQKPLPVSPINTGFDKIRAASAALRKTILLKQRVDSITSKKQLTASDSVNLGRLLDSLQEINKTAKP